MADVNGVLLWYQCFRRTVFVLSLITLASKEASSLVCYCAGHCPSNQPNGTCLARPQSQCFSAVEQIYNPETGLLEYERTYGCLPPEESGLMLCKGYLVPHQIPKSIACCSDKDLCNKFLTPLAVAKTTTPNPMLQGERMTFEGPYHLLSFCISFAVILSILLAVIVYLFIRLKNQKLNRSYCDAKKSTFNGDSERNLLDRSNDTSGSGSGDTRLVQRTIGKQIEWIERIGMGRFGEVWKARLRDEFVAVKIFFTKEEASWLRETDIYKTVLLRHENILGFVASDIRGNENGSCTQMLLITDYLELGSLHDYLKLCILDFSAMLKLAHSAACGISHLHEEVLGKLGKPAIAHRDIKSRNILVKKDRTCAIADFGLAVKYKSDIEELDVAPNPRVGTRRYMPPEVLDETIETSHFEAYKRADIYSFALVLWEIARRCKVNGIVEEYQLPFYDCVPTNPSFEDMKKVVCIDQIRPSMPKHWSSCETMQEMVKVMEESWRQNSGARLTALRIKKNLSKLEAQNKDQKLV